MWDFDKIKENLEKEKPQTGDSKEVKEKDLALESTKEEAVFDTETIKKDMKNMGVEIRLEGLTKEFVEKKTI